MDEHCGTSSGGSGAAVDGEAPWGGAADAAPGLSGSAAHEAGISSSAQQVVRVQPQARASLEASRRASRPASIAALCGVHVRLELDVAMVGAYMRDAIERGGYRAALEYYDSDESKKSDTLGCRLRTKSWLLGRLGLYDRMKNWLEEAASWDDFDQLLAAAGASLRAPYRTPALWLETPKPVPRGADVMMTFEPVASACRDMGAVPGDIWTVMLILDATGPIYSHAGLGSAAYLAATGADCPAQSSTRGDLLYDPRRGAKLHSAPEGCHRWIIADIDFKPRPPNKPHYYYDLTDEGHRVLDSVKNSGAQWTKATEAAAAGLGNMALPDMLESACGHRGPTRSLGKMRGDLGRLVDAWRAQDGGRPAPPVDSDDQALVDLGLTAKWPETGSSAGSSLDHLLYLMSIIVSTATVACEAEPATGAESAVLQTLIAAIQDLCRKHGRAVAAVAPSTNPLDVLYRDDPAWQGVNVRRRPLYADVTPPMISDLYYCLAEYCKSRHLATDPCGLPFSEMFTDDERAAIIDALKEDSLYSGVD